MELLYFFENCSCTYETLLIKWANEKDTQTIINTDEASVTIDAIEIAASAIETIDRPIAGTMIVIG